MRLSRRELTIAVGLILAFVVPLTVTLLLTGSEAGGLKAAGEGRFGSGCIGWCCRSTPMTPPRCGR